MSSMYSQEEIQKVADARHAKMIEQLKKDIVDQWRFRGYDFDKANLPQLVDLLDKYGYMHTVEAISTGYGIQEGTKAVSYYLPILESLEKIKQAKEQIEPLKEQDIQESKKFSPKKIAIAVGLAVEDKNPPTPRVNKHIQGTNKMISGMHPDLRDFNLTDPLPMIRQILPKINEKKQPRKLGEYIFKKELVKDNRGDDIFVVIDGKQEEKKDPKRDFNGRLWNRFMLACEMHDAINLENAVRKHGVAGHDNVGWVDVPRGKVDGSIYPIRGLSHKQVTRLVELHNRIETHKQPEFVGDDIDLSQTKTIVAEKILWKGRTRDEDKNMTLYEIIQTQFPNGGYDKEGMTHHLLSGNLQADYNNLVKAVVEQLKEISPVLVGMQNDRQSIDRAVLQAISTQMEEQKSAITKKSTQKEKYNDPRRYFPDMPSIIDLSKLSDNAIDEK